MIGENVDSLTGPTGRRARGARARRDSGRCRSPAGRGGRPAARRHGAATLLSVEPVRALVTQRTTPLRPVALTGTYARNVLMIQSLFCVTLQTYEAFLPWLQPHALLC